MMTWCFHHNDLDGYTAAGIVNKAVEGPINNVEAYYGMDILKDREFTDEDVVYFVDFCPTREQFDAIKKQVARVVIIDHHDRPDFADAEFDGAIDTESNLAGCELAWNYFFTGQAIPEFVHHIGRYDVWDHRHPDTLKLYYGAMMMETDPSNTELWEELFNPTSPVDEDGNKRGFTTVEILKNMGSTALLYRSIQDEYKTHNMYVTEHNGLKILCLNGYCEDSYSFAQWFAKHPDEDIDAVAWYYRIKNGKYKYSIRNRKDTVDVGEIARSFGGGGRTGTAGFVTDEIVF